MRRTIGAVVAATLLAVACGEGTGAEVRDVVSALEDTRAAARFFVYTDESLNSDQTIVVEGRVQDDFRYAGAVSLDGVQLYEQIVSDDAVAIRLFDAPELAGVLEVARRNDPVAAAALAEGRWVVDFAGAPELAVQGGRRSDSVPGDEPFVDAASVPAYAAEAMRSGRAAARFNPDDIEYNPLDDPWSADGDLELEDRGIRRMDLVQRPLPQRAQRGQTQSLPETTHFRKMAIYLRGERAVEVREQISIDDRQEFRRAEDDRAADYFLDLRDRAKQGAIDGSLRERRMTYEVEFADVEIAIPEDAETAAEGLMPTLLEALIDVFDFQVIGDALPTQVPEASPGPAGSPAATAGTTPEEG